MSLFYQRMFLSGHAVANFADGEMYLVPGALSRPLKKYYPEIKVPPIEKTAFYSSNEFNGALGTVLSIMTSSPEDCDEDIGDNYDSVFYAPEAEWFVKHTPIYGFAAKGGNNGEFHNHNDVGHFIYARVESKFFATSVSVYIPLIISARTDTPALSLHQNVIAFR